MLGLIFLVLSAAVLSACEEPVVVQVKLGQDVTLPCQTDGGNITGADWTRSDPKPSKDILVYSDGHTNSDIKDRVQLVDGGLKTGDVSLILKNVSREDVGTYECRVITAGSGRKKRDIIDTEPISIVQLQVTDPEDQKGDIKDGHKEDTDDGASTPHHGGFGAAAGVFLLVCSAVVGLFLVRKSKRQRDNEPEPSADEETGDNLL